MKINAQSWILLQALPAPQTRLEWIFALLLLFLTIGTLGMKWIQEHFRRNRPVDDTNASHECKELRDKLNSMESYLKERTVIIDQRFNLSGERIGAVERATERAAEIAEKADERSISNRNMIRKLINRVLNKSL